MNTNFDVFRDYGAHYDALYEDKDYVREVTYIVGVLCRVGLSGTELLEFGSGTGKHGRLMAQRGFQVHGIERSLEMITQSETVVGFSCELGDIREIELDRYFDAVLALFHVVSYQVANADINAVFACASKHLNCGGLFLFDIWYSPAVLTQRPSVRVKHLTTKLADIIRVAEPTEFPNENRVDVNYSLFVCNVKEDACNAIKESHSMRHFSLPELDMLSQHHGFEKVLAEEFLSGKVPGNDTWSVCVVLKKV